MNKINVLDCTLRDGGYINDWNFGKKNIERILLHLTASEIDIIECGFLSIKNFFDPEKSIFDTIERIRTVIPLDRKKSKYVCMINYGEYHVDDIPDFDGKSVDGIRVAFHKKDLNKAISFCRKLAIKGYMLLIQPMVTINYSDSELLSLVNQVNEINPYALYIVDSFGVMKKNDLNRIFYLIDNNLNYDIIIGYHSHNNFQLSYSNAQSLVDLNTKRNRIIDASVHGIGRGAGNLNTELFIEYLNMDFDKTYKVYPLLQIIDETLSRIYSTNYWGYSLPHYLSATYNCHPNYATFLSNKNTLTIKSISELLSYITEEKRAEFNKNYIEGLYINYQEHFIDDSDNLSKLSEEFFGKNILILAPGKSISNYKDKIYDAISMPNTISISINFLSDDFNCNYAFFSNSKRFNSMLESGKVTGNKSKLISTSNINSEITDCIKINYASFLNKSDLVKDNSTLMFLNLLLKLNISRVLLAGFDGYTYDNMQNYADKDMLLITNTKAEDFNKAIAKVLNKISKEIDITFLTPTLYSEMLK